MKQCRPCNVNGIKAVIIDDLMNLAKLILQVIYALLSCIYPSHTNKIKISGPHYSGYIYFTTFTQRINAMNS